MAALAISAREGRPPLRRARKRAVLRLAEQRGWVSLRGRGSRRSVLNQLVEVAELRAAGYGALVLSVELGLLRQWVGHLREKQLFTKEAFVAHSQERELWAVVRHFMARLNNRRADDGVTARRALALLRHVNPDALERRARRARKLYAVSVKSLRP